MQPCSSNSEYCDYIQYFRQANEPICKESIELEERINNAVLKLEIMSESLNSIHKANDEHISTIERIKTDIQMTDTWYLVSIGFVGLSILTTVGICYCNYPHAIFNGGSSINLNGGR